MAITAWDRLIRYVSAKDGKIRWGEPVVSEKKPDIDDLAQKGNLKVRILEGPTPIEAKQTGEEDEVKQRERAPLQNVSPQSTSYVHA